MFFCVEARKQAMRCVFCWFWSFWILADRVFNRPWRDPKVEDTTEKIKVPYLIELSLHHGLLFILLQLRRIGVTRRDSVEGDSMPSTVGRMALDTYSVVGFCIAMASDHLLMPFAPCVR